MHVCKHSLQSVHHFSSVAFMPVQTTDNDAELFLLYILLHSQTGVKLALYALGQ